MCSKSEILLQIDVGVTSLRDLVTLVLKGKLGFNEPIICIGASGIYEEGEDADEDLAANLVLMLEHCPGGGVRDGTIMTVEDLSQDLEVRILVEHRDRADFDEEKEPLSFVIGSKATGDVAVGSTVEPSAASEPVVSQAEAVGVKRKRDPTSSVEEDGDDEIICL